MLYFILSNCRNLLSLKNYEGDFDDIALNFTVMNGEFGNVEVRNFNTDFSMNSSNLVKFII